MSDAELGPLRRSTGDLVPEDMELLVVKPDAELKLGCLCRSTGDTGVELFVLVPDAELGPLRRSTGDLVPEDMDKGAHSIYAQYARAYHFRHSNHILIQLSF